MALIRISPKGPQTIACAVDDGEGLIVDVSALRSDAVVELQCGVEVLALRDGRGAPLDRIELSRSAIHKYGLPAIIVVFVTEPPVEHGRTLSLPPVRMRVATIHLRSSKPQKAELAFAAASTLAGALTLSEAIATRSYASDQRSLMCALISLAGISMGAVWIRATRRKQVLGVRWKLAAAIATMLAVIPLVAGARVITLGSDWPLEVTYELRTSALWSEECDEAASRQRSEAERRLIVLPERRWSQQLFPLCVSRPGSEQRFALVSPGVVRDLGLGSVSRCASSGPHATRCVLDMNAAARIRGESRVALDASTAGVAPTVVRQGGVEPRDVAWMADVLNSMGPVRPRSTFIDRFALRYELRPGLALEWTIEGEGPMLVPSVALPVGSNTWTLLSSDAYLCRYCNTVEVVGLAPLRARAGRASVAQVLPREDRQAIFEVPMEQLDHNRADAPALRAVTREVKLVQVTHPRSMYGPPMPIRFDSVVGFALCPTPDANRDLQLTRVFGTPAGAGVTLTPQDSERRFGTWTSIAEQDAERYVILCHERMTPDGDPSESAPVDVLVGSMADRSSVRVGTLVPRRVEGGTIVYDLRISPPTSQD